MSRLSPEEEAARPRCECHGEPMTKHGFKKNGDQNYICRIWVKDRWQRIYQADPKKQIERTNEHRRNNRASTLIGDMRRQGVEMTKEEYDSIVERSGGVCEICGERPLTKRGRDTLCLDHNHQTLKARGLLCLKCNTGLGGLGDSVENIERAIAYLQTHGGQ